MTSVASSSLTWRASSTATTSPDGREGGGYVQDLGNAIAAHSTTQTKIDFVRALAPDTVAQGKDSQFDAGVFSRTSYQGNPQAVAVSEVLSSLRGA